MKKKKINPGVILWVLFFVGLLVAATGTYSQQSGKHESIAQVYKVSGKVTVTRSADGQTTDMQKGVLLGSEDSITLMRDAVVGLYFKDGGKREILGEERTVTYRVGDLLLKEEAYQKKVPVFGATRGIDAEDTDASSDSFFYPRETVIVDYPPLVELVLFGQTGLVSVSGLTVKIMDKDKVLDKKSFHDPALSDLYSYSCPDLQRGRQYDLQIEMRIKEIPDATLAFTSSFYLTDEADKSSQSAYEPFSDSMHRSLESVSTGYRGKKYKFWFLKHLGFKKGNHQPVISVEILVKPI